LGKKKFCALLIDATPFEGQQMIAAVKKYAGESAPIQRCQVHKRRNLLDHFTDEDKPIVAQKLNAAYALEDYAAAKPSLDGLHRELMHLNPSAARSLAEGMEETLTVHRLRVPPQLRLTLASPNVLESAFAIVERVCLNVKRWHWRRSAGTLGRLRITASRETVPPCSRIQTHSRLTQSAGNVETVQKATCSK
jgi:transposase-like protein